jgi:integrase
LLSVVDQPWFKDLIFFTVLTGMRRGEVVNLHWNDINLERKLVHIHSTSTFRSKWGKQRVIPLNDQVVDMLKGKISEDPSGFVFTLQGRKVKQGYLSQRFKDYVGAASITKRVHFHSLRHSHATWLLQNSVSIYEVQKLLGHSSIETTQIYSHLQSEQLHATVNRICVPRETK